MRRLIRADLRRVMRKKSIVVFMVLMMLYLSAKILLNYDDSRIPYVAVRGLLDSISGVELIIGLLIFVAIYSDDFRAMSYVTAIGRGIPRFKIIIAKLLDIVLLSVWLYGIIAVFFTWALNMMGCVFSDTLAAAWFGTFLLSVYRTVGYIALASMVIYITGNIPLGTIVLVLLYIALPFSANLLALNENLTNLHIDRFHYAGIADNALTDIMFGSYFSAIIKLAIGIVIDMGAVLIVTGILFEKRELDF